MSRSTSRRCSALRAMTARTFSAVLRPPRPALFPGTPPRPAAVRSHGAAAPVPSQVSLPPLGASSDGLLVWDAVLLRLRSGTAAPTSRSAAERTAPALSQGRLWSHLRGTAAQHQV